MNDHMTFERRLNLDGVYNLRDIGGYSVPGGRTRPRTILRADSPHRLSPAALAALNDLGLRTTIDLRRDAECAVAPSVFRADGTIRYVHLPLQGEATGGGPRPATLRATYSHMLAEAQPAIVAVLRTLAQPAALPALVHCTAGKDRTGLIIALLLGLAGVTPTVIAADYALSAQYLGEAYRAEARLRAEAAGIPWAAYQQFLICPPDLMLDTLDELEQTYGGVRAYLSAAGLHAAELDHLTAALVEAAEEHTP